MRKDYLKRKTGYTLIETMISVSLFIIIVVSGMGALLNASTIHQKSQDTRSIMDNLNYIMEDMSRNLRTGYNYRCYDSSLPWSQSYAQTSQLNTPRSCASGGAMVFESTEPQLGNPNLVTDQWVYKIESTDGGTTFNISKSTDGAATWVQLNPSEVVLQSYSGFSVLGAELAGNTQQPFIVIKLVGTITYKNVVTPFSLQTSMSQRYLDI